MLGAGVQGDRRAGVLETDGLVEKDLEELESELEELPALENGADDELDLLESIDGVEADYHALLPVHDTDASDLSEDDEPEELLGLDDSDLLKLEPAPEQASPPAEAVDVDAAREVRPSDDPAGDRIATSKNETELRKEIEEFYLPRQLVEAILEIGSLPKKSEVHWVGIGFLDIADYTRISRLLSPQENQDVLNGLYAAFAGVLNRHGGYLNKIEGDSLMFHYGGNIDRRSRELGDDHEAIKRYIATELFYSCVEMQRVCALFNKANEKFFLVEGASDEDRATLAQAYRIISELRSNPALQRSANAVLQVRIRIGADIGEVTIGSFGPNGAKQWDIIGAPVIDAKRMETTAPVGGLRIGRRLYDILEEMRIVDDYHERFVREARALNSYYRGITREELFRPSEVVIKEKRGARFETYSVQVIADLPKSVAGQVGDLLEMGSPGADRIIELIMYYRGNRYVVDAIEATLTDKGVVVRKESILETLFPHQLERLRAALDGDREAMVRRIHEEFSLFGLLEKLGEYQDKVRGGDPSAPATDEFRGYADYFARRSHEVRAAHDRSQAQMTRRAYFWNVIFPLVRESLRGSLLEYQATRAEDQPRADS